MTKKRRSLEGERDGRTIKISDTYDEIHCLYAPGV